MQTLQTAKHELLESVEYMLTPQTLSDLVQRSISHVRRSPLVAMGQSVCDWTRQHPRTKLFLSQIL